MAYNYDDRGSLCDASTAVLRLRTTHNTLMNRLNSVQSHADLAANNYALIKACHDQATFLNQNLRDYATCSSMNWYTANFRDEAQEFLRHAHEAKRRESKLKSLYHQYSRHIASHELPGVESLMREIERMKEERNEHVEECEAILDGY